MKPDALTYHARPALTGARMVLGLSGWMDGGDVSTGTIETLVARLEPEPVAEISPETFYLHSFPGTMEIAAMFRPYTEIADGLIRRYQPPRDVFYCAPEHDLLLFEGKEPHLRWEGFAECIFHVAETFGVRELYFVGSVAGVVPHTREPRIFASVSGEPLKAELEKYGIRFSNYSGPASLATFLTHSAGRRGLRMATLVAEIPAYIQGRNPRCIEAMLRRLGALLALPLELEDLRMISDAFEKKIDEVVEKRSELAQLIRKLESDYDSEVFDTQMGDLKNWLQQQGIRLD